MADPDPSLDSLAEHDRKKVQEPMQKDARARAPGGRPLALADCPARRRDGPDVR
jgi:hypothetical protein